MTHRTWREIVGQELSNSVRKRQFLKVMPVDLRTLQRWVRREIERPSDLYLNALLTALPDEQEELLSSLHEEFPDFKPLVQPDPILAEVSTQFYARILEAYATTAESLRFWTLCSHVLWQLLDHLERDSQASIQLIVARCTHPLDNARPIYSLHQAFATGTPPFSWAVEVRPYFVGSESLSGYVISSGSAAVIQDAREEYPQVVVQWAEHEVSAAGFPILSANRIAGCLRISASEPRFFTHRVQKLCHYFSRLLSLAFNPEDFFERSRFHLEPMPYYKEQDRFLARLQPRIATLQKTLIYEQAERLARLELEDELRRMVSTSSIYGENDHDPTEHQSHG